MDGEFSSGVDANASLKNMDSYGICVLVIENYENARDPQVNIVNYGSDPGDLEPLLENLAKIDSRDDDIDTEIPVYEDINEAIPTTRFLMWDDEDDEEKDLSLKKNLAHKIMSLGLYDGVGSNTMIRRYSIHYVLPNINQYMKMKTYGDEAYESMTGVPSDH